LDAIDVGFGLTDRIAGMISDVADAGDITGLETGDMLVRDAVTVIVSRAGLLCLALPVGRSIVGDELDSD